MHTIIGTRDSNSSTFLKLEGGSGLNKKINLIDIKICFSNIAFVVSSIGHVKKIMKQMCLKNVTKQCPENTHTQCP